MPHTVRTTMRPDQDIEVGDAEYLDLQRQGLIAPDTTSTTGDQPATPKTAAPTTGPGPKKEG